MKIKPKKPIMQRIREKTANVGKRMKSSKNRIMTGVDVND